MDSTGATPPNAAVDGACAIGEWPEVPSHPPVADEYELERFVREQMGSGCQAKALGELRGGRKQGHWSWYIFPTPPKMGQYGRIVGSLTNRRFSLKSDAEAGHKLPPSPTPFG